MNTTQTESNEQTARYFASFDEMLEDAERVEEEERHVSS